MINTELYIFFLLAGLRNNEKSTNGELVNCLKKEGAETYPLTSS